MWLKAKNHIQREIIEIVRVGRVGTDGRLNNNTGRNQEKNPLLNQTRHQALRSCGKKNMGANRTKVGNQ